MGALDTTAKNAVTAGVIMLLGACLAFVMTPRQATTDTGPKINLEAMIPENVGNWRIDPNIVPVAPPPDLQAVIDKTYDQTLARTYVDETGRRIMLSIAYGGRHGEGMQTHRPEVCYPAQGFQIKKDSQLNTLTTPHGAVATTRLVAVMGPRVEPITYWVVVGNQQTQFGMGMKFAQMKYGLTGVIPDGMLIRVSSIDRDETNAYRLHEDFLRAMLASMNADDRIRLLGNPTT